MREETIARQFKGITKGIGQELLEGICMCLVEDHKRSESGYGRRVDLDQIGGVKIASWMYGGILGIGTRDKISYVEKIAQTG